MGNELPKDAKALDSGVKDLIKKHGIEPWNAKELIKEKLERQAAIARRCPLKEVNVEDGLKYFSKHSGQTIKREAFVKICSGLLDEQKVWTTPGDRDELNEVFASMDFDGSGELDRGEWAGGLSVFFKGTQAQCIHAVFGALDKNGDKSLSETELGEYLKPVVKAMIPKSADQIKPHLIQKATNIIYSEMDADKQGGVTAEEMVAWSNRGNNLVSRLADVVDQEVYRIWLQHREQARGKEQGNKGGQSSDAPGSGNQSQPPDQTQQTPGSSTAQGWQQGPPGQTAWQQGPVGQTMPPGAWQQGPPGQSAMASAWQQPGAPGQTWQQGPPGQTGWQQPGGPPGQSMAPGGWQQGTPGQSMAPGGWQQGPPGQPPAGQTMPFDAAQQGFCQTQGPNAWQQQGGPPQPGYCPTQGPNAWQQTQMGGMQPPGPWGPQNPNFGPQPPADEGECGGCCGAWPLFAECHGECGECGCDEEGQAHHPQGQPGQYGQYGQYGQQAPEPKPAKKRVGGQRPERDGTVWYGRGWGDSVPEGGEVTALLAEGRDWRAELPESYPWNVPPPPPRLRGADRQGSLESQGSASPGGLKPGGASPALSTPTTAGELPRLSSAPYTPSSTLTDFMPESPGRTGSPSFRSSGTYVPRFPSD